MTSAGLHDFSPGALKKIMSQSAQFIAVQPAPDPAVATAGAPPGGLPGVAYNPTAQQGKVVLQVSYIILQARKKRLVFIAIRHQTI